jgi:hypothetical protein
MSNDIMWLLLVEAGVAFFLLVLIVWWTMFAGPKPPARPLRDPTRLADSPLGDASQHPNSSEAAPPPDKTP